MSENPDSVPPPAKDQRPRPQYGELAPEGWTWQPPQDTNRVDPAPAPTAGAGAGAPSPAHIANVPVTPGPRTVPRWDRQWTIALLVLGLLGTTYFISSLLALPQLMAQMYAQFDLGAYASSPAISAIVVAGVVVESVVWIAATGVSFLMLRREKRAFYIPIIGGIISLVVVFIFLLAAILTDPTLLEFASRQ
ncbi:DUF6264 family protein [Cryobacterium aureum]|uniref:DUF6264 family protein n=1 Tax=Cryobacterium aureum TaxID=995037 RepID=UPI00101ADDF3|nr:DUF6264 family protein [Cryobacterium aureum]